MTFHDWPGPGPAPDFVGPTRPAPRRAPGLRRAFAAGLVAGAALTVAAVAAGWPL